MPAVLRPAAQAGWVLRWSGILAVADQRALAASLLHLPLAHECSGGGAEPALHELLADVRWHERELCRKPSVHGDREFEQLQKNQNNVKIACLAPSSNYAQAERRPSKECASFYVCHHKTGDASQS